MSDGPIQRKPRPTLDGVLTAYERRARLIAQLHEQAIATANAYSAQYKVIRAFTAKDDRRRKAEPWLCVGAFLLTLGGIVAAGCILAVWL
jgi:hypothetical protein